MPLLTFDLSTPGVAIIRTMIHWVVAGVPPLMETPNPNPKARRSETGETITSIAGQPWKKQNLGQFSWVLRFSGRAVPPNS